MNKTIITGNIGADAESRITEAGKKYIMFNFAHTEKYGDKENTTWFTAFIQNERMVEGKLIDFLKKGTKILVEGKLTARPYTANDGQVSVNYALNVFNLELIGGVHSNNSHLQQPPTNETTAVAKDTEANSDEDLPF